jgi:acetyl-CoA acetyltransferase
MTLAVRAAREASEDAGIDVKDIDGTVTYQAGHDSVNSFELLPAIGCRTNRYASNLNGGGNYGSLALVQAAQAVIYGLCEYVLVYRAMNGRSGVRLARAGSHPNVPNGRVGGPKQFTLPYGLATALADHAFQARRYMELYRVTSLDFARFAVESRSKAVRNPRAIMRKPITVEDHQKSPWITTPYHLLDCCLETDAGCAVIVASAERAQSLRKRPVLISAGSGGYSSHSDIVDTHLVHIGPRLLEAAGIRLGDVDIFECYDNFTDVAMRLVEDMGWCPRGEAKNLVEEGRLAVDGDIAVNTHGGLMNEGYCHGLNNVLEAVQQLRGEAEDLCPGWMDGRHTYDRLVCRQVRDPQVALNVSDMGASALVLRSG